ncbi:hypothetical protein PLEOSDRAFT_1111989 [Pleurotus ostreatus PC15]|uniref:Uncharacterized protein n=1 Tax=Pleurotus ostreatus (strain PC15) TaxID=1137138 RepID=A0A067NZ65_PLEO1|nr:hypothetical protein PLEOSDRAFT_1111989 [Pleurotus ostreatus PC15]
MPLFGTRRAHTSTVHTTRRHSLFHRKDRNHVAAGYKSALSNPHTTRAGRKQAKRELRAMGRGSETHVPFMTKVKRALGIRSTPRRTAVAHSTHY